MKKGLLLLGLAIATGCGSVTAGLDFKAPAGWSQSPSILGMVQVWSQKSKTSSEDQTVLLIRGRNVNSMNFGQIPQVGNDLRDVKKSTITICKDRSAQYLSATGTGHNGDEIIEAVSAPVGDTSYLSMYIRPQKERADPQAEAAIRSLCLKQSLG